MGSTTEFHGSGPKGNRTDSILRILEIDSIQAILHQFSKSRHRTVVKAFIRFLISGALGFLLCGCQTPNDRVEHEMDRMSQQLDQMQKTMDQLSQKMDAMGK